MARSTKIYIVHIPADEVAPEAFCAAFTVRHECITWLQQQPVRNLACMKVTSMTDGLCKYSDRSIKEFDPMHFIDGAR